MSGLKPARWPRAPAIVANSKSGIGRLGDEPLGSSNELLPRWPEDQTEGEILSHEIGHFGPAVGNAEHDHPLHPRITLSLKVRPRNETSHAVNDEIDLFNSLKGIDHLLEVGSGGTDLDPRASG